MRRRKVADWSAGAFALVVLALGGLVVVKPAVDHWDSLYRADPFFMEKASAAERVLGKSGLIALRLIAVAIAAFLIAAVVQRVILAEYGLRSRRVPETGHDAASESALDTPLPADDSGGTPAAIQTAANTADETIAPNLASPIAKLVTTRREELGLSQRELAKRAGISHTLVSRVEQGDHTPSRKTLERLADVLGAGRT